MVVCRIVCSYRMAEGCLFKSYQNNFFFFLRKLILAYQLATIQLDFSLVKVLESSHDIMSCTKGNEMHRNYCFWSIDGL